MLGYRYSLNPNIFDLPIEQGLSHHAQSNHILGLQFIRFYVCSFPTGPLDEIKNEVPAKNISSSCQVIYQWNKLAFLIILIMKSSYKEHPWI